MEFKDHYHLKGLHAPFSASSSHWLRYSDDKLIEVYHNIKAKERGTKLHEWAQQTIDLGIKQPRTHQTLHRYVNDAIGYKMSTEVVLYYSEYFFGTADAISFRKNKLRIHDLKTGKVPASMEQLLVYAALFCLEYHIKPGELEDCELRIYQNDDIQQCNPTPDEILHVMDKIVSLNKVLVKNEED